MAPSVNLIVLRCADLDLARDFHTRIGFTLEAEQHGRGPAHLSARSTGLVLELYPCREGEVPDRGTQVGVAVPDLPTLVGELSASGVAVRVISDAEAVATDPDGRMIRLTRAS